MVNPNIAPPAELSVSERIVEVEKFLKDQEEKVMKPLTQPRKLEEPADDVLTVLKKISENQEIERKRYERNNPVEGDEPIYDWAEATIDPGQMVQFSYLVPEGHVFFFEYLNITHQVDTIYYIWIDNVYQPTLSQTLQDFGDHAQVWKPPKMCYNTVEVWALNNWIAAQTYSCFFRGFNRFYRAIKREITYESLIEEKQET